MLVLTSENTKPGLHWAYAKAEGWTIIQIWNNGETDLLRLIEFGPILRSDSLWVRFVRFFRPVISIDRTPDIIKLRQAPERFHYIVPELLEPPADRYAADLKS